MDNKATQILFKTYWSAAGWIDQHKRATSPEDFAYAKGKGVMFDPVDIPWEEFKQRSAALVAEIPVKKVTDAFLSSLSNKRYDWRSGLGSYANLSSILNREDCDDYFYDVDEDDDLNVLNFERIKWGGVRHGRVLYNYLDLTLLNAEQVDEPTAEDLAIFADILGIIDQSAPGDTPAMLRENLKQLPIGSKNMRHHLIEILACCDILKPLKWDRPEPHTHDWDFALMWRGEDKYEINNLKHYFGRYGFVNAVSHKVG